MILTIGIDMCVCALSNKFNYRNKKSIFYIMVIAYIECWHPLADMFNVYYTNGTEKTNHAATGLSFTKPVKKILFDYSNMYTLYEDGTLEINGKQKHDTDKWTDICLFKDAYYLLNEKQLIHSATNPIGNIFAMCSHDGGMIIIEMNRNIRHIYGTPSKIRRKKVLFPTEEVVEKCYIVADRALVLLKRDGRVNATEKGIQPPDMLDVKDISVIDNKYVALLNKNDVISVYGFSPHTNSFYLDNKVHTVDVVKMVEGYAILRNNEVITLQKQVKNGFSLERLLKSPI